ncbi:peptidase M55 [Candidatus Poribacteria bacterium]|nr:peptidase M55 [Candidatus Poribacteria bacterium]
MKIYISADIEGATGVVHGDQTGGSSTDYMRARKFMTGDVNAAIEGALKAGADEVWVKDAHANARNILLEELNEAAYLISGWDVKSTMVQGIDDSFHALILIGYHSMAGTENGILSHTFSGVVKSLSINGVQMGEPELSSLIAGYYGVPVVFIAGDQTAVKELTSFVGDIPHAITKYGMWRDSGRTIHPSVTGKAITDGVSEALSNLDKFKPFQVEKPVNMSLRLTSTKMADLISLVPGVEKTDIDRVDYQTEDVLKMTQMFRIMLALARNAG